MQRVRAWAAGTIVVLTPSMRLWSLSRRLRAPVVDVMGSSWALFREWECIADAEAAEERRRDAARARQGRR